ncbi:MAG: hypothetical protein OXG54_09310, partial [Gammaproteobacteria bacterium]|nr:hypothetical protein [Gammaproteobacteria bacterium]
HPVASFGLLTQKAGLRTGFFYDGLPGQTTWYYDSPLFNSVSVSAGSIPRCFPSMRYTMHCRT